MQKVHFGLIPALKMPPSKWPGGQKSRERRIFSKLRRCQFSIVTSYRKSERNCLYLFIDRIYQKISKLLTQNGKGKDVDGVIKVDD